MGCIFEMTWGIIMTGIDIDRHNVIIFVAVGMSCLDLFLHMHVILIGDMAQID